MGIDASIAMSVQDNLSAAIVSMKNSMTAFRTDVKELEKELYFLNNSKANIRVDMNAAMIQVKNAKKAFQELGDEATEAERKAAEADWKQAVQNLENIRQQYDLVGRQVRQTTRDMESASGALSRAENRAGGAGGTGMLSALGKAGLYDMLGEAAGQWANTLVSSGLGSDMGSLFSSALSGAGSGAAIGTMIAPGIGTAVGAAAGAGIGLLTGASQVYGQQDEAFKAYYQELYEAGKTSGSESLTSGSATAAQRQLDAIAFNRLLGEGVGDTYLTDLRSMAADTPMEYAGLTSMSRALATGFKDAPDRILELMEAIGDTGSAVGVTASDMTAMAQAMSRMQSSGKATLEYLNIFQDRGVDVIGMLSEAMGKTQSEIYDMISKGEIGGQTAVDIIQEGMSTQYGGAMETMARTFSGLTSTLSDTMTEIDAARGEGYNETRTGGLQAEVDAYGGELGEAVSALNRIAGQNEAYLDNLSEQYTREALSAVLLGQETTLFSPEQQAALEGMRDEFVQASADYEAGSQEAGLKMDNLRRDAEALAAIAYESSDVYQMVHDAELDLIDAIRENTAAYSGWRNDYELSQALSKGRASALLDTTGTTASARSNYHDLGNDREEAATVVRSNYHDLGTRGSSHAYGLERVPYDGYAAVLHEGERVLTAREAREADRDEGFDEARAGGLPVEIEVYGGALGEAVSALSRIAGQEGIHSARSSSHAYGLERVPYDGYAAVLHQGERVLTAREAREADRNRTPIQITITGNQFGAGVTAEEIAQRLADALERKLAAGRVRT